LVNVLNQATADGFVYRVDMRLRPNGNSGPLALGFEAMEQYYQTHGREWERYALIKARVVAGDRAAGEKLLVRLRPFVYRKYLDYGAVEAIREMKVMINRELQRKGMPDNIKLGPGGIREIEFIGQAFQLIRAGRERDLQERSILSALHKLSERGHLVDQAANELAKAYVFLRNTENRLQMIADRQTHELPKDELDRLRLANAMGFEVWPQFEATLRRYMSTVQRHFDQVFAVPQAGTRQDNNQGLFSVWLELLDTGASHKLLTDKGFDKPNEVLSLLRELRAGPAYSAFSSEGRSRMDRLIPLLLAAAGSTDKPVNTLVQLIKLIEAIGRRSAYLVLLIENPDALLQLVRLCAASSWIASWISQHPVLLDELIDPASLYALATKETLSLELAERLRQVGDEDLETQMEVLREFRHGHILRIAAADVGPGLNPEQVSLQLAHIAEVVLQTSLELAYAALVKKHGEPKWKENESRKPDFAIIAYGKLGSIELGYGSDLDLIFLYDGEGSTTSGQRPITNEVFFARLGQRIIHMLTTRTHAGLLYEADMRLRPSGKAGPLVTTLPAFSDYQHERAWTWEHQALVRARAFAGSRDLCQRFVAVRREILCQRREAEQLREDIRQMRARMESAQADHDPTLFDIKHDRGGIVDIEFMVQYWVLLLAADNPGLTEYTDNVSILGALADAGLLDAKRVQLLVEAYRCYLSTEHRLKLAERKPLIAHSELSGLPERVAVLWRDLFERDSIAD
jgi:glutamate-ammonia-ligase adenylyltransferase